MDHSGSQIFVPAQLVESAFQHQGSMSVSDFNSLGAALQESGRAAEAERVYRQALAIWPNVAEIYCNLGNALHDLGKFEEAEQVCRQALAINPGRAVAHNILGSVLQSLERPEEAEQACLHALSIQPGYAKAYNNLGAVLHTLGRLTEAEEACLRALEINPDLAMAYNNLGVVLRGLSRLEESEQALSHALALMPGYAGAFDNLAVTLKEQGKLEEAKAAGIRALALCPDSAQAYSNLGVINMELGLFEEATTAFRQALVILPDNFDAHWNLSLLTLQKGDFEAGWKGHEWRFHVQKDPHGELQIPRYDGSNLKGKTVFVYGEQGVGEEIMFSSCLGDINVLAGHCILECDSRLVPLFSRSFPTISVIPATGRDNSDLPTGLPHVDFKLALGSLPHYCRNFWDDFKGRGPWLIPCHDAVQKWRRRYDDLGDGLKVGIAWRGGIKTELSRMRSTRLIQWQDVFSIPGVQFVNLQYGDCSGEIRELEEQYGTRIHSWEDVDQLRDLDDFAAQVAGLDLVITIDNTTAHMAGAVGRPVWCLLSCVSNWRWLLDGADSPWYPTMRLFRQTRQHEWESVFGAVVRELGLFKNDEFRLADSMSLHDTNPINLSTVTEMAKGMHDLGVTLLQAGNIRGALIPFKKALNMAPDFFDCSIAMASCLHMLGKYDEALSVYDTVLGNRPDLAAAWNNRGNTLLKLCRYEQAVESYSRALELAPGLLDARVALATCYQALGMVSEAMSACKAVLEVEPMHAEAHWNKALLLLLLGDYRQGWLEYEWRWQKRDFTSPLRDFAQLRWQGEEIAGKIILIHAEQGFGDTLQFCRYIPLVAARGARVIFECHPPLVPLMEELTGVMTIVPAGQPLPSFDLHMPLLSLPLIFDTVEETIPSSVPYLFAPPDLLPFWRNKIADGGRFKVGLCWAGKSYPDPGRSCPIDQLAPLADLTGVEFYSLQIGWKGMLPLTMVDHLDHIHDFGDTAALISRLDLIITIDTAVAHLAGAMGKPTWVMLPFASDWRWMLDRHYSPWYPSMDLYRQVTTGSWRELVKRIGSALQIEADRRQPYRAVK